MTEIAAPVDLSTPGARLEAAIADLEKFRREWAELGSPAVAKGSRGQVAPHPYVRLIREAERAVEMMARPAVPGKAGRPPGSSSAPDRAKLRVVGGASS